jgi:DNA invertase Pin-like site-specific DNA recombinase
VDHFLESVGVSDGELSYLSDEGISGEELFRPGINQVREGIQRKAWDLIVVEDSSRLFRDPSFCIELVRSAVHQGIRVICINDYVDTAEEDRWEEQLYEAQRHHSSAIKYGILRIKRAQDERWNDEAAMGPLRSGYRRVPSFPATHREPAKGP